MSESYNPYNTSESTKNQVDITTEKDIQNSTKEATKKLGENIEIKKEESGANAPHTIASALNELKSLIGGEVNLEITDENFKSELDKLSQELSNLKKYIESKASTNVNDINDFLKSKGIDLELKDQGKGLYSASILDVKVEWKTPGKKTKFKIEGKEMDAVSMKEADKFYESPVHDYPIVEIETQSGEKVFMTKYDGVMAKNSIYVHNLVRKISSTKQVIDKKYKGVTFPMVDFEDKGDITELLGGRLETENGYENIAEAKYFHRFRMNEVGAHAEAAAAVSLSRGISFTEVLNINGPFLVWIETEDGKTPFAAKIGVNDMKNPGDIGEKTEQTQETTEMGVIEKENNGVNKELLRNPLDDQTQETTAQTTNSNSTETNSQEKLEETEVVQKDSSEQTEKTEQTNEQENTSIPYEVFRKYKKSG